MSHAAGVGPAFPREVVRAMLLLRANTLALGLQRLPAAAGRSAARLPSARDPPGRPGAGERGRIGRSRAARAPCVAPDRSRPGGIRRVRGAGDDRAARGRVGAADARVQGRAGAAQRHPDDERDRGAAPGRCGPPRPDGQRRRGHERRGAARHGCRVRGCVPAGPAAPRPDRGRRGAASPPARQRAPDRSPRACPQGPGPVLAALCAAGPWRRPRHARPPPPGPRHRAQRRDRQPARLPRRRDRRRGHDGDRWWPGHQRRQLPRRADRAGARFRQDRRWPSSGRSASGGRRCSWIRGSTAVCRRSSRPSPASTPG